jgi:prephenate dehydrogenase
LTLAIKSTVPDAFIVAVDADANRLRDVLRLGKVDRTDSNLSAGCRDASLIIINAPLLQLREALEVLGPQLSDSPAVLALAPVAGGPLRWANEFLSSRTPYLVCHLTLHPDAALSDDPRADLFHGAVLCMLATADTPERALKSGSDLAKAIGARGYFMDAVEHDALFAMAEGIPGLVSAAVLLAATRSALWSELMPVSGVVFKQATEPLFDPALDAGEALIHNREEVLRSLDAFLEALREVRQLVDAGDAAALKEVLMNAAEQRVAWLSARPRQPWSDEEALAGPPRELPRFDPIMPGWGIKKRSK